MHHVRRYVIKIGVPPPRDGKESLFVPRLINSMAATAMTQDIVASLLLSSALGAATTPPLPSLPDLTAAAMYNSKYNSNTERNIDNEDIDKKSSNNNNANDDDDNNKNNNVNGSNIDNAVPPVVLAPLLLGNLIVPLAQYKLPANNDLGVSMTLATQLVSASPAAVGEGVPRGVMETSVAPKTSPVGAAHDGHSIV